MERILYDEYKQNFFPIVVKIDEDNEVILAVPLKNKYPFLIFPNDTLQVRKMLSAESLIYFTDANHVLDPVYQFAPYDETSILFGRKVKEKYIDEIQNFVFNHNHAIKRAHRAISREKSSKILYYEFYKNFNKTENMKGGITYGTIDEY